MKDGLFLDDVRNPKDVTWIELPYTCDWAIVRNYNEFVEYITNNGLPKFITFDHDLAFERSPLSEETPGQSIPYCSYKEMTGNDCAKWLVEYCLDNKLNLPSFAIHSMNSIGKKNIKDTLGDFYRIKEMEKS